MSKAGAPTPAYLDPNMTVSILLKEIKDVLKPIASRIPSTLTAQEWEILGKQFAAVAQAADMAFANCERAQREVEAGRADLKDLRALAESLGITQARFYTQAGLRNAVRTELRLREQERAG